MYIYNVIFLWIYLSYYRHRYKLEKMSGDLNDTLPLSTNNYNQEVIEISDDDEGTYTDLISLLMKIPVATRLKFFAR